MLRIHHGLKRAESGHYITALILTLAFGLSTIALFGQKSDTIIYFNPKKCKWKEPNKRAFYYLGICRYCAPPDNFAFGSFVSQNGHLGFELSEKLKVGYGYCFKIESNVFYYRESAQNNMLFIRCSPLSINLIPKIQDQYQYFYYYRTEVNNVECEDLCIVDELFTSGRTNSFRFGIGINRNMQQTNPLLCLGYGYNNKYAFNKWMIYSDLMLSPREIDVDTRIWYSLIGENFKLGASYFRFCNSNYWGIGIKLYFPDY